MPHRKNSFPMGVHLGAIVLLAVFPVLIFSAVMVSRILHTEREASERLLLKNAEEMALAFDQELFATIRALESLGLSNDLTRGDLRGFHTAITKVLAAQSLWRDIVLHDQNARWLLNARESFGTNLGPAPEPASILKVSQTGLPAFGKLIKPPRESHGFAVRVPVKDSAGQVRYVLSAIISTDALQSLVSRFSPAPGEMARTLADPSGTIGARTKSPEKFVGGKVSSSLLPNLLKGDSGGILITTTLENVRVSTGFRRAPFSGWYAAIGVPEEIFEAPVRQTRFAIFSMVLLVLVFSALSTIFFARWLRSRLRSAADGAANLARGLEPGMKDSYILELEELRDSLTSASKLLRSRDRAKSDFLANMSHELRTPLGVVLGVGELLANDIVPPADRAASWNIVKRNGQQLQRLIDDILDFSKIEANRLTIEKIFFSLPDLVSAVVEDLSSLAMEKNVVIKVTREAGFPEIVNSDPVRVRQIFSNLVGNAVKFTHGGEIETRLLPYVDGTVRIIIKDTGIGLNPSQQAILFTDFTQGDSSHSRKYGGTGLGLSLSRKLARLLGGDVKLLESQTGRGSTFEITFLAESGNGATLPPSAKAVPGAQKKFPEGTKILLAEDSPDNVVWIEAFLAHHGAKVTVAENGIEAVEKARAGDFDLILMDIQMPDMDGYEATRRIREEGINVPIVALTAHALAEHRARALQTGFTDFLTKPIQHQALLESVDRNLRI